ncbi:MAG: hypothetical protein M1813_009681 [Trichoglossum hirsutum]|nr:MAG: hypothetical protein M1813_009681 [Trichoglossum hirsutum]
MPQKQFTDVIEKLAGDRAASFRGTAIVRFEFLQFGAEGSRELNSKNVETLKKIFENGGCSPLEPRHHIPAIINQNNLNSAIKSSGISSSELLDNPRAKPPELKFPLNYRLQCLHGQHRIEAGREALPLEEKWWAVDIYLDDMSPELKTTLIEEYSKSIDHPDGHIYQKICQYRSSDQNIPNNIFAEMRWWANLTYSKRKDLKQLLKHETFSKAFHALLVIPGLWSGLRIGSLHKIIAIKCDEEILHYLDHILKVWSTILGKSLELMALTNQETVEALQLRAPGKSQEDLSILQKFLDNGELFPEISQEQRRTIGNNLCKVSVLIPSIYTFFEDVKYLKPCMNIIKRLVGAPFAGTVCRTVKRNFSGVNQEEGKYLYEFSESRFNSERGGLADQKKWGYRQLCLYAMRNFPKMIAECPRKEDGQPTPVPMEPDQIIWSEFATIAYKLGFESKEIHRLMSKNPDRELARSTLLRARRPSRFKYDEVMFESFLDKMVQMFTTAVEISHKSVNPPLLENRPGEVLQRRCGRAFQNAHEYDRQFLFLPVLYNPRWGEGTGITSFFVRRSVYLAFFGEEPTGGQTQNENPMPSSDSLPNLRQLQDGQAHTEPLRSAQLSVPAAPALTSDQGSSQGVQVSGSLIMNPESTESTGDQITQAEDDTAMPMEWASGFTPCENEMDWTPYSQDVTSSNGQKAHKICLKIEQKGYLPDRKGFLPMDPEVVNRIMCKALKEGYYITDIKGRSLTPDKCYNAVVADGSFKLLLQLRKKANVNRQLLSSSADIAGGGLPNVGIPTLISPGAIKEFQLALFLENLESSFFNTGLTLIRKWGINGYPNDTIEVISRVAAQEKVHIATFTNLLKGYNAEVIPPCNYSFPVNSTKGFFELANAITSVGIGATIGFAEHLAVTDPLLLRSISSILTVESRHDAFFRHIGGKVPNPSPFDTGINEIWAYNLALPFIVSGSCSIEVPLPILPTLSVSGPPSAAPANTTVGRSLREFTWDPMQIPFINEAGRPLLIGWVNQLNIPVYTKLNITVKGKGTADVPQGMNGVVFAVVTTQRPNNVDDLALATLAGPVVLAIS